MAFMRVDNNLLGVCKNSVCQKNHEAQGAAGCWRLAIGSNIDEQRRSVPAAKMICLGKRNKIGC
eukprot:scaffold108032_cov31-Prasinocladus_malaysianus.AAC.1